MTAYWLHFASLKRACVETLDGEKAAIELAEKLTGDKVTKCWPIPYPAIPRLNELKHEKYGVCPAFCYRPDQCAGKSCCPQEYACTE